jgi:hypothetical protein
VQALGGPCEVRCEVADERWNERRLRHEVHLR